MVKVRKEVERKKILRLLVVEDNKERIKIFKSWFPEDVMPVFATSAGRAVGILQRDKGSTYAGVMLDHDLHEQPSSESDYSLSGSNVVKTLIESLSRETPVLVHSMNPNKAPALVAKLEAAGFWVTRCPMNELTFMEFRNWFDDVRDLFENS